jgi:cation diffusion facilitator family transporter
MKARTVGYLEGGVSAVGNTALFAVKLWAGIAFSSVAIVADAWHTLSDTFTSVVVIAGFWLAARPPDRRHPFGHGRAEGIAAIIVGTLLCVVGFSFAIESLSRLRNAEAANFAGAAIMVCLLSAIVKEAMAQFAFWSARRTGAQSLRAEAWHHRTDAISSIVIVAGALFGGDLWWIDGVMGLAVSALIIHAALDILKTSAGPLLGEAPAEQDEEAIREAVRSSVPEDIDLHHVHVHRYGDHVEVTLHIRLPSDTLLGDAHETATTVEEVIRLQTGMEATVHTEPAEDA